MATRPTLTKRNAPAAEAQPAIADPSTDVGDELCAHVRGIVELNSAGLRLSWRNRVGGSFPAHLPKWLLTRLLAYRLQASALGDLDGATWRKIRRLTSDASAGRTSPFTPRVAATAAGIELKPGALLTRGWNGRMERVMILDQGFAWNGTAYSSLSQVAKAITGVNWNGHRFFGLRKATGSGLRNASDAQ